MSNFFVFLQTPESFGQLGRSLAFHQVVYWYVTIQILIRAHFIQVLIFDLPRHREENGPKGNFLWAAAHLHGQKMTQEILRDLNWNQTELSERINRLTNLVTKA
jgi:hypothetical protein